MKKVAVVGFGFMGMTHTMNIIKNPELDLVAIVDIETDEIEKKLTSKSGNFSTGSIESDTLKKIRKYQTLDECLEKEELDAIHICVHTNMHYIMAKKALECSKHVFLEKPFTLNIKQAEELIALAKDQKRILMVAHVVRFMPPYMKLKQLIDSEEYGKLKFLSLSRFSGIPTWGQWKEKQKDFGSSGGALFDLVIHDIDFVNYLLGLPEEIKCNYLPGELSNHDYISALWLYKAKGIHVRIEGGNTFHTNFPFQAGYIATFENASLLYTTFKGEVIQIATENSLLEIAAGDAGDGFYNEIAYFASCINNNIEPIKCMPESSLQTVQLCYNHL
ncbi:gfo/Idh/MocA family oxidoreductase [Mariniphaga sediminis]|uniref:Gfo/Idh/MocA family oxidoreductase n=1 Tax=Mariniphaga sediminis TaxID=1628158 RepID=A0A399D250_9BACT|nr:Gfo/Idh/MocA family oxidoreductase [Mariniphaga sediminis]RIH65543.1 gfo/Idh/MocA family oxidoreductase [Mariniphaga sediminis]